MKRVIIITSWNGSEKKYVEYGDLLRVQLFAKEFLDTIGRGLIDIVGTFNTETFLDVRWLRGDRFLPPRRLSALAKRRRPSAVLFGR